MSPEAAVATARVGGSAPLATTPKPTDIDLAHAAPHTAIDVAALNQRGGAF